MKKAEQKDVINFVKEKIIHRFEIPQPITIDQGIMFTREKMNYFAADYGIQHVSSTPFYAHVNGQVEASNKVLIGILEKMLKLGKGFYQRQPTRLLKGVL